MNVIVTVSIPRHVVEFLYRVDARRKAFSQTRVRV